LSVEVFTGGRHWLQSMRAAAISSGRVAGRSVRTAANNFIRVAGRSVHAAYSCSARAAAAGPARDQLPVASRAGTSRARIHGISPNMHSCAPNGNET
jgi:hypothetical protein